MKGECRNVLKQFIILLFYTLDFLFQMYLRVTECSVVIMRKPWEGVVRAQVTSHRNFPQGISGTLAWDYKSQHTLLAMFVLEWLACPNSGTIVMLAKT